MAEFDDLTLQRSSAAELPPPPPSRAWLIVAAVVVLIGIGGWYWWRPRADPAAETRPVQVVQTPATVRNPEPGDNITLPPLDATDPVVRELVSALSSHPRVAAWLATDGLIRNFTVSVQNAASGRTPSRHLKTLKPEGPFRVLTHNGRTVLDPRSYQRYDSHADAVGALDAQGTARLYATLRPRIEEAQAELGQLDSFDAALERTIVQLLATPVVEGPVRLEPDGANFRFEDPELESLSSAQRQFLRMGPRNMRIVQAKLREIARYLDIPPASLPAER